jgi:hypothetical protein
MRMLSEHTTSGKLKRLLGEWPKWKRGSQRGGAAGGRGGDSGIRQHQSHEVPEVVGDLTAVGILHSTHGPAITNNGAPLPPKMPQNLIYPAVKRRGLWDYVDEKGYFRRAIVTKRPTRRKHKEETQPQS